MIEKEAIYYLRMCKGKALAMKKDYCKFLND